MCEEVVERRSVCVRHGPFDQELVVIRDRDRLQLFFRGERLRKPFVDFGENARQVPSRKIFSRWLGRGRAPDKTPSILLEVVPVPIRQYRVHHRLHFTGGLGDSRFHPGNSFLGLVAFNVALEGDFHGDRFDRLRISSLLERPVDDGLKVLDSRFG